MTYMAEFRFNAQKGVMERVSRISEPVNEAASADETKSVMPEDVTAANVGMDEGIVQFRERSDYTIFQFIEPKTQRVVGYIGGYALDFSFNISQIHNTETLEMLLEGIKGVFRKMISEQILQKIQK